MSSKRRLMVAGLTMALMPELGACGSGQNDNPWEDSTASGGSSGQRDEGHDDDQGTAPDTASEAATVTGLRDAVRHVSRKTTKVTRPHTVRKRTSTTVGPGPAEAGRPRSRPGRHPRRRPRGSTRWGAEADPEPGAGRRGASRARLCALCGAAAELDPGLKGFDHTSGSED